MRNVTRNMSRSARLHDILLLAIFSPCVYCLRQLMCGLAKEGEAGNMTIHWDTNNDPAERVTISKDELGDVFHCVAPGSCSQVNYIPITNLTVSTYLNTTIVTIRNVSRRHEGMWRLELNSVAETGVPTTCRLSVYAMPKTMECKSTKSLNNTIIIVCTAVKVYPKAKCILEMGENQSISARNNWIHFDNTPIDGDTKYFTTNCTVTLNIADIHNVQVLIFPNITGSRTDVNFGLSYRYSHNATTTVYNQYTISRTLLLTIVISVTLTVLVIILLIISVVQAVIKLQVSNKRSRKVKEPYDYIIGFQVDNFQIRRTNCSS